MIDATILPAFGRYYLIIKDETSYPPKKHLCLASSDDLAGPYVNLSPTSTRDWVEGPSAIQIGDEFFVYYDAYTTHRYAGKRSKDLQHWQDITGQLSFPRDARPGTVIAVPTEYVDRLRSAMSVK